MLLVFIVFSLIAINPQFLGNEGVTIRSVATNSSANIAGMKNPSPTSTPLMRERIISINQERVDSLDDFFVAIQDLNVNASVKIETNEGSYKLKVKGNDFDLGLKVSPAPFSNLRKGLDLEGGIRVLLQPAEEVSKDDLDLIISNLNERLNVFGLSDVVVRSALDLSGVNFVLIEIAGVTEEEVRNLLSKQGKFEAKINEETVFFGGKKDITYVCRTADCSGIDPQIGCYKIEGGYGCNFFFSITLSNEAAERQAEITNSLKAEGEYLSEPLVLILDDTEVDRLQIASTLKGVSATNIQISGSGVGRTQEEAATNTLKEMKRLQTILITGSLPVKLDIVKLDIISPFLGKEFLANIFQVGLLAFLAVAGVVFFRYRKIKIVIPMVLILLSELVLILGFAALVRWSIDLAAIAGILIIVGTGVDHLIVITDETMKGEMITDWKKRIKAAMFIIIGAYLTTLAGMMPLIWAGAGLLKGFALTTIAGLSFGVLIARPAYATIIQILLEE